MKKSELKKLMNKYLIFESDLDGIFEFCEALLNARARETESEYPYAHNTIQKYDQAAYEVYDLTDYVYEILREEDEDEQN